MTNINRRLHELLGGTWDTHEGWYGNFNKNPDYCADPRLVLKAMMEREDYPYFSERIGWYIQREEGRLIYTYLIMDTTGKLAQLAIKWLEEGK